MKYYLLSGNKDYADVCPFGVSLITAEQLAHPKTHLLFVTADSTCFVDVKSKIPIPFLPTVNKVVRIIPILPEDVYQTDVLDTLLHLYPENAAALRRSFIFGEDAFRTYLAGLGELYQWEDSIKTQLGGLFQ